MTDEEILKEIERRLIEWFTTGNGGWHDCNAGFSEVQETIRKLRNNETWDWE